VALACLSPRLEDVDRTVGLVVERDREQVAVPEVRAADRRGADRRDDWFRRTFPVSNSPW
jgi:hypothetical protein